MLAHTAAAFEMYQQAVALFEVVRSYWGRMGVKEQAQVCAEIVGWLERLIEYIGDTRLNPSSKGGSQVTLLYPCRTSFSDRYLLAEFVLVDVVDALRVESETMREFLARRSRAWRRFRGIQVDGYRVGAALRVFGINNGPQSFDLNVLNPAARFDHSSLVLPAGAPYRVYQVNGQPARSDVPINPGDYLLACGYAADYPLVWPRSGDAVIFERDQASGRVHVKRVLRSARILGETIDFDLRPA